ncbi:Uma2 family endonuclease [Pendulispora rubella]|uniref:Uma2 family endonuclease n=1 Tax=Pendulispora rubella TaxID=2741070 RepID=A0ABZ2KXV8_9BACT
MAAVAPNDYSFADYLDVEERSPDVKHEFFDGTIWAMAGGTIEHARVSANIVFILSAQLRGRACTVYTSDLRVSVPVTDVATYPDVTIICGRVEVDARDASRRTATNPTVVVEVLSPRTEKHDRGRKLENYKRIESLQEIVFVAHDTRRIEVVRRLGSTWKHFECVEGEAELASVQCRLPLAEVYLDPTA